MDKCFIYITFQEPRFGTDLVTEMIYYLSDVIIELFHHMYGHEGFASNLNGSFHSFVILDEIKSKNRAMKTSGSSR